MTVLVVDDQPLVREAFAALVAAQPGLALCGQAGTHFEALTRYQALRPDVVVVNLRRASPEGLVTVRSLRSMDPRALVVAITAFDKDADIPPTVVESGIRGRLLKGMGARQFAETIHAVARGVVVLPAVSQGRGAAEPTVLRPSRPFGSAFWRVGRAQGS